MPTLMNNSPSHQQLPHGPPPPSSSPFEKRIVVSASAPPPPGSVTWSSPPSNSHHHHHPYHVHHPHNPTNGNGNVVVVTATSHTPPQAHVPISPHHTRRHPPYHGPPPPSAHTQQHTQQRMIQAPQPPPPPRPAERQNLPAPTQPTTAATPPRASTPPTTAAPPKLKDIPSPHSNDVLCGRGGSTNRHIGNANFRQLIASNKPMYVTLTKKQKMMVARSIVDTVRSQDPPGRFLQKSAETGLWFDIGRSRALEKTSQALREKHTGPAASASSVVVTVPIHEEDGSRPVSPRTVSSSESSSPSFTSKKMAAASPSSNNSSPMGRRGKDLYSLTVPKILIPLHLEEHFRPKSKQLSRTTSLTQERVIQAPQPERRCPAPLAPSPTLNVIHVPSTSGSPPPPPLTNRPHHVTIRKVSSDEMMATSSQQQMRHSPHLMNGPQQPHHLNAQPHLNGPQQQVHPHAPHRELNKESNAPPSSPNLVRYPQQRVHHPHHHLHAPHHHHPHHRVIVVERQRDHHAHYMRQPPPPHSIPQESHISRQQPQHPPASFSPSKTYSHPYVSSPRTQQGPVSKPHGPHGRLSQPPPMYQHYSVPQRLPRTSVTTGQKRSHSYLNDASSYYNHPPAAPSTSSSNPPVVWTSIHNMNFPEATTDTKKRRLEEDRTYTKPVRQVSREEAPQMKVTPSSTPPPEEATTQYESKVPPPSTQYESKVAVVEESSEEEGSAPPVEKPKGFLDGLAALSRAAALQLGE
mmetsp:Transcript_2068/g.2981  ORF Transcript_2068/g.2981 Transcript_2068/m.2981 type:complete len:746 (+) Transcript_2068:143-2380(+)